MWELSCVVTSWVSGLASKSGKKQEIGEITL